MQHKQCENSSAANAILGYLGKVLELVGSNQFSPQQPPATFFDQSLIRGVRLRLRCLAESQAPGNPITGAPAFHSSKINPGDLCSRQGTTGRSPKKNGS